MVGVRGAGGIFWLWESAVIRLLQSSHAPYPGSGVVLLFLFNPARLPYFLPRVGQSSPCSTSGRLSGVIMQRTWSAQGGWGGLALSSVFGFSFCDTLEREMSPTSPNTTLLALLPPHLPSCMFSDLPCFVPLGPPPFTWFPPSSPHLGKGSSLELQGVECNVFILFCLCPHPTQCSEEPEKNLLLPDIYM